MVKLNERFKSGDFVRGQSKSKTAWQQDVETGDSTHQCNRLEELERILRKLHFTMALFGIYHLLNQQTVTEQSRKRILPSKAGIYNLFVLVCLWLNFFKFLLASLVVDLDREHTMLRVLPGAWSFQVAINATILLKASHPRFGYAVQSSVIWREKLVPVMEKLKLDILPRNVKRQLIVVTFVGWVTVVIYTSVVSFLLLYPNTSYYLLVPKLFVSPLPINIYTKIFSIIPILYMSVAWIMPMVYTVAICVVMTFAFKTCLKAVEQANRDVKERNIYPRCLYHQRLIHLNMCKIVDTLDKDLRYMFANTCFTSVPILCLFLYQILKTDNDSIVLATYAFSFVAWFTTLVAVCSFAATVNKAAHAPLNYIYETGLKGVSLEQIGQVNFFVSKLSGSPIGFSILDFVVITKELLLTVGGIFLTYAFVLLQF